MNISTKSVTLGPITLNNIKQSKVPVTTKEVGSNVYEEIDYNDPSFSTTIDEEIKELESIRDILVSRKDVLMPAYTSWDSRWKDVCMLAEPLERAKQRELIKKNVDSQFQQLNLNNSNQNIGDYGILTPDQNLSGLGLIGNTIDSSIQWNAAKTEYIIDINDISKQLENLQTPINTEDPHYRFYEKVWLNHQLANDNSLIDEVLRNNPSCKPEDYYLTWFSLMKKKNVCEFLLSTNNLQDKWDYGQYVDFAQQKQDMLGEKSYLEKEISTLDMDIRQLNDLIAMYPYNKIMETSDFKQYAESFDQELLKSYMAYVKKYKIGYNYLSDEEKILYNFLLEMEGQESADNFLDVLQDKINQRKGYELAYEFIDSLDLDSEGNVKESVANFLGVSVEGLDDGINTFFAGIKNAIINNDEFTVDDYKKMIVIQYLQEHSNYKSLYEFNSSLGNMLPSMVASIIVSVVATPVAGSTVATSLIGVSSFGNAKHQALVNGHDSLSSTLYGLFVGSSEATLGYFLGKIPGISQTSGLTFKNLLMEGAEEFSQEWIDAGLQAVVLGEDVDWSSIPEQSVDAFIMGVMMSGFLNGGQKVIDMSINGIEYTFNVEKTLEYIKQNPNVSLQEAVSSQNPSVSKFLEGSKIESIGQVNQTETSNELNKYYNGKDDIPIQLSLDATAVSVSVDKLENLLLNDEVVAKFNDYENNLDYFGNIDKKIYIKALKEYYTTITQNGYVCSESVQKRYNSIIPYLNSFIDICPEKTPGKLWVSIFNKLQLIKVEDLDNKVFNNEVYNSFSAQLRNETSYQKLYAMTKPFHQIQHILEKSSFKLTPMIETRLKYINQFYNKSFNLYRTNLSQYSYYGADQGVVRELAISPYKNIPLYMKLENTVKRYYPNMSKSTIRSFLRSINVKGICSYATVANEILMKFNGKEDLFRQYFGFDMYRYEKGKKVLNDELILTDLYCYANQYNDKVVQRTVHKGKYRYSVAEDDSGQIGMSYSSGKSSALINSWIQSKGMNANWYSSIMYSCQNRGTTLQAGKNITTKIREALVKGHTVELDVFSDNKKPMTLILYSTTGNPAENVCLSGDHAYGHSMMITGVTESGDLIVSSWKNEYIIKWTELEKVAITINESYIE